MYYDQGGMGNYGSQPPLYQTPQYGPSAGGPLAGVTVTPPRKRRQPSYADYYSGASGGYAAGGNSLKPTNWAEAQQQWEEQQKRMNGRLTGVTPALGQMPAYSQPGQYRPSPGGMGGQQYVQRPGNTGVVHPLYSNSARYGLDYGSQMPFSPGYLR